MFSLMSFANAVETTLADYYLGNFIKDSYKVGVTISGESYYWVPLHGRGERGRGDYFILRDGKYGKYSINVKFGHLTESGEKKFIATYNSFCESMFAPCNITVFGDIGLSSDMSLFLNARKVVFDDLKVVFDDLGWEFK
jgi:hypothetical protein